MTDIGSAVKIDIEKDAVKDAKLEAQKALNNGNPETASLKLRQAADSLDKLAEAETLQDKVNTYRQKATRLRRHANEIESDGMEAAVRLYGKDSRQSESDIHEEGVSNQPDSLDSSSSKDTSSTTKSRKITNDDISDLEVEIRDESFEEIGGLSDIKRKLKDEVVTPIQNKSRYRMYGIDPIHGVMLMGEPGTGKTLLARGLSGETGWNFIEVSSSEVYSHLVGKGADKIKSLFKKAKDNQPCILFLDEFDNIAKDRGSNTQNTQSEEALLTQILTEMNNLGPEDEVVVIAATNRPGEVDDAILNARRFPLQLEVPTPDRKARKEILHVHLHSNSLEDTEVPTGDIDYEKAAKMMESFCGDNIREVANKAGRMAIKEGEETGEIVPIKNRHVMDAIKERDSVVDGNTPESYLESEKGPSGGDI